jgi:ribosome maturation factor RimP
MAAPLHQKLTEMAQAAAAVHGLVLVQAKLGGQSGRSTLQVLLETPEGTSPDVALCAKVSRMFAAQLDVEDIIQGKYFLEVSSPGLDRPLTTPADCKRFVGKGAAFKFKSPQQLAGKPVGAAKGVLQSTVGDEVTLQVDGTPMTFNFNTVHSAELAPTAAELTAFMGFSEKPKRGTPHPLRASVARSEDE